MPKPKSLGSVHGVHMNLEEQDVIKLDGLKSILKSDRTNTIRTLIRNAHGNINLIQENETLKEELEFRKENEDVLIEKLAKANAELESYKLKEEFNKDPSKTKYAEDISWIMLTKENWAKETKKEYVKPILVKRCKNLINVLDSIVYEVDEDVDSEKSPTSGAVTYD
jgi:hypothetical protein